MVYATIPAWDNADWNGLIRWETRTRAGPEISTIDRASLAFELLTSLFWRVVRPITCNSFRMKNDLARFRFSYAFRWKKSETNIAIAAHYKLVASRLKTVIPSHGSKPQARIGQMRAIAGHLLFSTFLESSLPVSTICKFFLAIYRCGISYNRADASPKRAIKKLDTQRGNSVTVEE